jgi:ubiquinone/menaquinone biosynthesis C-methylase UbiE
MRCTTCGQKLNVSSIQETSTSGEIFEGLLACPAGHTWPVEGGILVLTREDAPSDPWSRTYAQYEKYTQTQEMWLPQAAGEVAPLLERLAVGAKDVILDICTGSGGLLFNLLNNLDPKTEVVSLDMSLAVQRHNRRYLRERYGNRSSRGDHGDLGEIAVSFVSADAADIPFQDGSLSHVVSFGIGNMIDKMARGVEEAARVLRPGGTFTFTHSYVDEDSEGWRLLSGYMQEQGVEDYGFLGVERDFVTLMDRVDFCVYEIGVTGEVVGDPRRDIDQGPLFPYPNERMIELLIKAVK